MNNFRKLKIWKKSVALATEIYDATKNYPKEELYGIVSQMRRAVVSISSNIAKSSSYELETQLIISKIRLSGFPRLQRSYSNVNRN